MLEGISSAAQLAAFQNLAGFDYLMISAKVLHASLNQVRARKELESLIALARQQQREVCANGIDTAALLTHAETLNIDIGFGRQCGRSEPFPRVGPP
jgi:EAL domain-containing protein (putative c-di-GMP-specific phosphodiesterase class I)